MKKSTILIAFTLIMSLLCVTACGQSSATSEQAAALASCGVIVLSVNPEIAVEYDDNGIVTAVTARNDDAIAIISSCEDLIGLSTREVMTKLVTAIGEAGYFVEETEGEARQITLEIQPGSKLPHDSFLDDIVSDVSDCVNTYDWSVPIEVEDESSDDIADSNDADYVSGNDGVTDYDDTDYGTDNDGVTDYDDTDYGTDNDGVTDYDDTDYGTNNDGVTDYDDTDYGTDNDGVTDYNDTDYGPDNDGVTDYDDTDYGTDNDGVTDYDDTDYGTDNDGVTDYDDTDYGTDNDGVTDYDDGNSDYQTPDSTVPPVSSDNSNNEDGQSDYDNGNSDYTGDSDYGNSDYDD